MSKPWIFILAMLLAFAGCGPIPEDRQALEPRSTAILLVTLDTTRADRMGFETASTATPNLDALAAGGLIFEQAYATAPMTLPSHTSILTGLYPSAHGIHENARHLAAGLPLLAGRLRDMGYATAAFVSAYPLASEFGLAQGFGVYDDRFPDERLERTAAQTTDRALAFLAGRVSEPLFLWVHYFDPHHPYDPPEPFRSRYPEDPYLAEIAAMDHEIGRLLEAFRTRFGEGSWKVAVVGDHGEGLGDHGEAYHGLLLYQGVIRVPLVIAGSGIRPGTVARPVSIRKLYDTTLAWAGNPDYLPLWQDPEPVVLAEAMKPFLQYGWSPQILAVSGDRKFIKTGDWEIFDVKADPAEADNLAGTMAVPDSIVGAVSQYALPLDEAVTQRLSEEQLERLGSLGYAASMGTVAGEGDRPDPRTMAVLFPDLDLASDLFANRHYEEAVPVLRRILERDPRNLTVCLRLAVAFSMLGKYSEALAMFAEAGALSPDSPDVRHYLGMHYFRGEQWSAAAEQFELVLQRLPRKVQALEALAQIREREGRLAEAFSLYRRLATQKSSAAVWLRVGNLGMANQKTEEAIVAFQEAERLQGDQFRNHLELGVCLLVSNRYREAAHYLDLVPPSHEGYAMALFKRAQASAKLHEPDTAERVRAALDRAPPDIRRLILQDPLLGPFLPR